MNEEDIAMAAFYFLNLIVLFWLWQKVKNK
jgi:hypothetical protein